MRRKRAIAAAVAASALFPLSQIPSAFAGTGFAGMHDELKVYQPEHQAMVRLVSQQSELLVEHQATQVEQIRDRAEKAEKVRKAKARKAKAAKERAAKRAAAKKAAARKRAAEKKSAESRQSGQQAAPGGFVRPARGTLTSGFGPRWGTSHSGIDIANSVGTPIYAVADGTVVEAGPASGFGLWIQIRHDDGTVTVYGHMYEVHVRAGQRVSAGQVIAPIGNNGQSTGPHLHFEVWQGGGAKVNPIPWLAARGVSV